MMMRCARLLLTCLLLAPLASAAVPELDPNVNMARSHFRRGVSLYRNGAYDAALAEFTRAYESAPNYRILYNLAQIQAQRQDFVQALELFERYLSEGAGDVPAGRAESVQAEIAELQQRTSRLRVDSNVDGARLFVNDLPSIELPLEHALVLNAGIHRLRLEKSGYLPASRTVMLAGGDDLSFTLDLEPELDMDEPAPQPAAPDAVSAPAAPDRTALWASLAVTGAFAGATVTLGVLSSHANSELGERLARYPASRSSVEAGRDRVRTFALLTDTLGVAAAAAAGLSTYFYFSTRNSDDGSGATSGVRARLGPRASGLWWVGEF
jgi:tetratricopeptide repeat protein/PEGA domain-containing protein